MVTVLPANDAPEAVGTIPDQTIELGDGPTAVDLGAFFQDVDGDPLTYVVAVSEPVVTAVVSGASLALTAVRPGTTTVTVTASDPEGLTATQTFTASASAERSRAVVEDTLAAMGRGHLASARATLGRRVAVPAGEATRLTLAGQRVPLSLDEAAAVATRPATQQRFRGGGPTEFLMAFGGQGVEADVASARRWTIWGQGDFQTFEGGSGAGTFDGDLRTGYLGVDTRLGENWLAGLAVARSSGASHWHSGAADGRLDTTLTSVQPYLRWSKENTTLWAMGRSRAGFRRQRAHDFWDPRVQFAGLGTRSCGASPAARDRWWAAGRTPGGRLLGAALHSLRRGTPRRH